LSLILRVLSSLAGGRQWVGIGEHMDDTPMESSAPKSKRAENQTLHVTPTLRAKISNHDWTIEELCGLLPRPISSTREAEKNLFYQD